MVCGGATPKRQRAAAAATFDPFPIPDVFFQSNALQATCGSRPPPASRHIRGALCSPCFHPISLHPHAPFVGMSEFLPGRGVATVACLVVLAASAGCSSVCPHPPEPVANVSELTEGRYSLTLVATRGLKRGRSARGHLTLSRLPRQHWGGSDLYGFTKLDFGAVGAPILGDAGVPAPSSKDPNAPGVLVEAVDFAREYPSGTPVLLVGTVGNLNPVRGRAPDEGEVVYLTTDGSGIGLWVHAVSDNGFVGRWSEWGVVRDGSGRFCAQLEP